MKVGAPIIGLNDSGGARIQEGVVSLGGYADIFLRNILASGVVPQISVILGPCAGGAVYSPAITDFTVMVEGTSYMFVTGPGRREDGDARGRRLRNSSAVRTTHTTIEVVSRIWRRRTRRALSTRRASCSGICRRTTSRCRSLSRLSTRRTAWTRPSTPSCPTIRDSRTTCTTSSRRIVDDGDFLEMQPAWAQNIIVGFARLGGRSVGVVAQQPSVLAGALDIDASIKAARFVRTCDAFNVPLVTFVDVPGFLPGVDQEHGGIIRHGAKLLFAYCEATVPKVTVITRKAYGGAYDVMSSKHVRGDMNFAWPTAEIAVMGAEGAVNIILRDAIAAAADPDAERARLVEAYEADFANPYIAAARGYVDDVIRPSETRPRLIGALTLLADKRDTNPRKKHGNIPL